MELEKRAIGAVPDTDKESVSFMGREGKPGDLAEEVNLLAAIKGRGHIEEVDEVSRLGSSKEAAIRAESERSDGSKVAAQGAKSTRAKAAGVPDTTGLVLVASGEEGPAWVPCRCEGVVPVAS